MGFFKMKKLILLIAIALIAVSTGLSLEPTRVSVYAPAFRAAPDGTPATSVRIDLVDYSSGSANTLFTGNTFTAPDAEVTADDNGVITVNVGQDASVAVAWDNIDAGNMNTFWTFDVYINGTLYSQGRIDQQVIIQANTSIFNSSGVLVPSGNPSTVGADNQRFDAVYVKGIEADPELEGVFIGPTGSAGTADLALQYDPTLGAGGEGIISSNGAAIMNFDATGVDLNGTIVDNVAEINAGNQALAISGAFTANQALNTIGDNTDGLQLTIDGVPSTQPVPAGEFELEIDGDAKMEYLEVSGFSLTGDFNMNDNTIYNVEEVVGRSSDGQLLLNATPSASPVWTANGPITTGTGLFTINGNLDATLGVDVTNADLTVGATNFVVDDATGNTDIAGTLTVDGNTTIGDANTDEVFFNAEVSSNFVPFDGNRDLGLDADHRWRSAYLNDVLHIGTNGGEAGNTELAVNYGGNQANFNVDGGNAEFNIDAGNTNIEMDPNANGTFNYRFEEGGLTVSNPGAFGDIVVTDGGILTANGQNFSFLATTGNIDVVVDGRIDVQSAASTIGDGADATQLTVEGLVAGAADALVVQGSTDIDARLNVDGNTTLNANVDLGDANTDLISFLGRVDTNVEPIANNAHALGSDALRWSALWVDGNAIHVGDASGDNTSELEIGYGSNVATFTVDAGADAELAINAASSVIELDPAGNGSTNYSFAEAGVTIDNGGTNVVLSDGALTSSAAQEFELVATGGNLDILIDGKIDVQAAASTIGDGTDAAQLTVEGSVGGANDFIVQGDGNFTGSLDVDVDLNTDGNTTLNGNVDLGDADTDEIDAIGDFVSNLTPDEAQNTLTLGEDDKRWQAAFIMGNSVHVGPEGGTAGNTELNVGYASNAATFNVNNVTRAQITINAGSDRIVFDPAGDNDQDVYIDEGTLNVNSGNVPLVITDGTVNRNNGVDQTLAFGNSGAGNLNVTIDGDLDVAEQITGPNVGHSLGTATTDGTVLNILGDPNNGSDELDVEGDVQIDGTTNIDGILTANAAANTIGSTADATQLTIEGSNGGTADALIVNGNALFNSDITVDDNATIREDLTVETNTDLQNDVILGADAADDITVNGEFVGDLVPNVTATDDLGTSTQEWNNLHLAADANVSGNVIVDSEVRYNDADQSNYVGFTSPAVVGTNQIWTLPAADGTADQQLITDGSGNLSWGSTSLQVAYEGGNEIITDAGDGDVIIRGTEELDIRVNIANDVAGNGAGITVDDDFTVVNGDISFGTGSQFTIVGSNGNTTTNGTLTTQGLVTANLGMNIFGANLTVGGSNFIVTTGGDVTIEGLVSANDGLNVTGSNFTVGGAANFQVVESNGNTSVGGLFDVNDDTSAGADANVLVLGANLDVSSLSVSHAAGSIVYVGFTTPSNVTGAANGNATAVNGATLVKATGGSWYIVGTF